MAVEVSRFAARGAVGAMAMTGVRTLAGGLGIVTETPPEAIAKEAAPGLLSTVQPKYQEAAIELLHWAAGTAAGAMFGLLPAAARKRPWIGAAYGLAIWSGFETTVAPALGLGRHQEPRTAERLVLAADHVLYGLILAGATPTGHKQHVRAIAKRTGLSRKESADVIRAALEGLAGQLSEGEARRLAADLPGSLAGQLRPRRGRRKEARPVEVDAFISQVSEHTGLTCEDVREGTAAMLTVLREALGEEDYRHLCGLLPAGYASLAEASG
jgi:uncharacterized protein (DUF2267 family)